MEHKEEGMMV